MANTGNLLQVVNFTAGTMLTDATAGPLVRFENEVVLVRTNGRQLKEAIESLLSVPVNFGGDVLGPSARCTGEFPVVSRCAVAATVALSGAPFPFNFVATLSYSRVLLLVSVVSIVAVTPFCFFTVAQLCLNYYRNRLVCLGARVDLWRSLRVRCVVHGSR